MQFRERGHGVWGAGEVGLGGCRCLHACTVHICFISFLSWGGATTTRRAVLVTKTVSPKRAAARFDQGLAQTIALVAPGMCVVSAPRQPEQLPGNLMHAHIGRLNLAILHVSSLFVHGEKRRMSLVPESGPRKNFRVNGFTKNRDPTPTLNRS